MAAAAVRPVVGLLGARCSCSSKSSCGSCAWPLSSRRSLRGGHGNAAGLEASRRHAVARQAVGVVRAASDESPKSKLPPDAPGQNKGREWFQTFFAKFNPVILPFEKPLVELDNRIKEVRRVAEENGVDVSEQIAELEERAKTLRRETYERLTPPQRLQVARHPNRPTFSDIALNISDKWVELHGDRGGYDDPAMVCGIASMDGASFMFIGNQKGRNTKENIERNFGMSTPNGYRKALRMMRHADKFGFPIVTFIDTPGAYAGLRAEELGQGEAIAVNLREMFGLRVPIIAVVIGEGGSGGALAIGCADRCLIMENAVYYVASPEACAAILWKSAAKAAEAAEALRITGPELVKMRVMDEIVAEPPGGAHADPMGAFPAVRAAILKHYRELGALPEQALLAHRINRFRSLGAWLDAVDGNKLSPFSTWVGDDSAPGAAGRPSGDGGFADAAAAGEAKWKAMLADKADWLQKPEAKARNPVTAQAQAQAAVAAATAAAVAAASALGGSNGAPVGDRSQKRVPVQ